ncbi:MAG: Trx7/PDZ domain-containing (seleno)protein [Pirellulales bacterium]
MRSVSLALLVFSLAAASLMLAAEPKDRRTKVLDDKDTFAENDIWIYNDLPKAFAEAKESEKPLLVVFRCVPCEACSKFDQHLLEKQEELRDVLQEFVCARVVYANGLDLSLFDFDFDQSFHAMVLRHDRVVLARYGTRSQRPEEEDMTVEGFRATLVEVLERGQPLRPNLDDLDKQPLERQPRLKTPEEFPSLAGKYTQQPDYEGRVVETCIHCHQVRDAQREWYRQQDKPIPDTVLFPQPLPDVLGLTMDPRTASRVASVAPRSLAAKAGLKKGDTIGYINLQPIFSTADLQWALHTADARAEKPGQATALSIGVKERNIELTLELPAGWRRKGDLSWRPTTWELRRMAFGGMLLVPLSQGERAGLKLGKNAGALLAKHVGQYGDHARAKQAGFEKGDIIVAVDGKPCPPRETDLLLLALEKPPGTKIPVTVRRGTRTMDLEMPTQ